MARFYIFCLLLLAAATRTVATIPPGATARFSFNKGQAINEINNQPARYPGTIPTEDRFGNANQAIHLFGNKYSYLNLGNNKAVKPTSGSISLWVNISGEVASGKGLEVNPILLTKCSELDDFFEAYGINYSLIDGHIAMNCSQDSTHQVVIATRQPVPLKKWIHLVLTFNNELISFYMNGALMARQTKKFETHYLATDSVLVGVTANKKNDRFLRGEVDDIIFYDRVLEPTEVQALYNAPDPNKYHIILNYVLRVLIILGIGALVYIITRWQMGKKEKERLEFSNKLLETELRVNRGLMNPHFIYNSLYSAQSFILNHEVERANRYLVKFSQLLRKILESNTSDAITLAVEIDLLRSFVEVENMKFDQPIDLAIETGSNIDTQQTCIPVMMLQPFVENAIWHGLKNKPGPRLIHITFTLDASGYIECVVEDNGLGRKLLENTSGNSSLATVFVKTRLDLLNKIHKLNCSLKIIDKPQGQGTIIKLLLPIVPKSTPVDQH